MADLPTGTITFLFTDIEASTLLWQDSNETMAAAVARHDELLRHAVNTHGGVIFSTSGDGVAAAFETASAAVSAALDAQRALQDEPWPTGTPIRVRMALHTGEAQKRGNDYFGTTLNRAARLMAIGHGEQVLLSGATATLVSDRLSEGVRLQDLGEHHLRDVSAPIRVFQLLQPALRHEFPPLRTTGERRGNIPVEVSTFIGRRDELTHLLSAVTESQVVTLVGVGGVGKTRLAIHAAAELAHNYPDGVWLCELAGADDPESLHQLVASSIGIASRPGLSMRASIVEYLVPKRILLVLDNCEHLIDAAAELTDQIRINCPAAHILATSREPLALDGERVFPLRSLSLPGSTTAPGEELSSEAVQLFLERAVAARPDFSLTPANAAAIVEICRRLDGIPLALELAGARVASMSVTEIAAHLDERFRLLSGRRRGTVERHQTLRATLDWSYSLLTETEGVVFDRLGVFGASFDTEAAQAVVGKGLETWDVIDALANLTAKSMVVAEITIENTTRYRMLETMRHYARERLSAAGEDPDYWWAQHAEYYARLCRVIGDALNGPDEIGWRRRLALELDDIRAAVNWSLEHPEDDRCIRIVAALSVQAAQSDASGIGSWATRCVDRARGCPPGLRTAVLGAAAWEAFRHGNLDGFALASEALRDGLPAGWPASYIAYIALAVAWVGQGQLGEATSVCAVGHEALDHAGAPETGHTHLYCCEAAFTEDPEAARQFADAALTTADRCGNPTGLALAWYAVGTAYAGSDPERAAAALDNGIGWTRRGAGDGVYANTLSLAAVLAAEGDDRRRAVDLLNEAVRHGRDTGNRSSIDIAAVSAIYVLSTLGNWDTAAILVGTLAQAVNRGIVEVPQYRLHYPVALARIRQGLGPHFHAATALGATLDHGQVVDLLLSNLATESEAETARGLTRGTGDAHG